ncbi:MAG: hypothetical protein HC836_41825 [Richelia sp. RM2_1_2]|nr:hypothetical protein [Richelia sp. RM2_1_2]
MLKSLLSIGVILLIAFTIQSCVENKKEITHPYPFKVGDKICLMGTFNGVVTTVIELGVVYYAVDFITIHSTKHGQYRDFQLSMGMYEPTTVELGGAISDDEILKEENDDDSF